MSYAIPRTPDFYLKTRFFFAFQSLILSHYSIHPCHLQPNIYDRELVSLSFLLIFFWWCLSHCCSWRNLKVKLDNLIFSSSISGLSITTLVQATRISCLDYFNIYLLFFIILFTWGFFKIIYACMNSAWIK